MPLLKLGASVVLSLTIWWLYLAWTGVLVFHVSDLTRLGPIEAGRGVVSAGRFFQSLALVVALSVLLTLTGHWLCVRTRFLESSDFHARDIGVCYFAGLALFVVVFNAVGLASGHAFVPLIVVLLLCVAAAVSTIGSSRVWPRILRAREDVGAVALWMPVVVAALLVLHYIVTKRFAPTYDEFARSIVVRDRIPALNRHYAQSLLAAVGLFLSGAQAHPRFVDESLVFVNNWLFVSQIALAFLLWRTLSAFRVSAAARWFGTGILLFGNSALSLLPHILYDHDYPLVLNIYTDSLLGIAGVLLIVLFVSDAIRPESDRRVWPVVPALMMAVFHLSAELNLVVIGLVLIVLLLTGVTRSAGRRAGALARTTAVLAVAAAIGAFQGGMF
jgi:hypothetical protein